MLYCVSQAISLRSCLSGKVYSFITWTVVLHVPLTCCRWGSDMPLSCNSISNCFIRVNTIIIVLIELNSCIELWYERWLRSYFCTPYYRVNILLCVRSCQKLLLISEVEWVALCPRIYIGGARVCFFWVIRIKYTLPIYFEFHISLSAAAFQQENGLLAHLTVRPCGSCVHLLWFADGTVLSWLHATVVSQALNL
jgi:hypothetical protein